MESERVIWSQSLKINTQSLHTPFNWRPLHCCTALPWRTSCLLNRLERKRKATRSIELPQPNPKCSVWHSFIIAGLKKWKKNVQCKKIKKAERGGDRNRLSLPCWCLISEWNQLRAANLFHQHPACDCADSYSALIICDFCVLLYMQNECVISISMCGRC